jgi:hypothetical protein
VSDKKKATILRLYRKRIHKKTIMVNVSDDYEPNWHQTVRKAIDTLVREGKVEYAIVDGKPGIRLTELGKLTAKRMKDKTPE